MGIEYLQLWCSLMKQTSLCSFALLYGVLLASAQSVSSPSIGFGNPMTHPDQLIGSASNTSGTASSQTLPNCATGLTYATSPTSAFGCLAGPTVLSSQWSTTDQLTAVTGTSQQSFATTYTLPANLLTANRVVRLTFVFGLTTSRARQPPRDSGCTSAGPQER